MRNKKGFTLIEILAVIVIVGIVAIIVTNSLSQTSNDTKEKMLETKIKTSGQQLILWCQDHINCFITDSTSDDRCIIGNNNDCENYGTNNEHLKCIITMGKLAENELIKYDDPEKKEVTNPTNKESLNDHEITLYFNKYTRQFSIEPPRGTISTTKRIYDIPEIVIEPDGSSIWSRTYDVSITIYSGTSGLTSGGSVKYGWSESNLSAPSSMTNATLNYSSGDTSTTCKAFNGSLTGKYYLWVQPSIVNNDGISIPRKISSQTFWFDNTPPANVTMNFVYGDWTVYNGEWSNKALYAARSKATKTPSGGADAHSGLDKYQISLDNTTWVDYSYSSTNALYRMTAEGDNIRYFRACDKVGNCGASTTVVGHIDTKAPVIQSFTGTTKSLSFRITDQGSGVDSYCLINTNNSSSCTTWTKYNGSNALDTGSIDLNSNPYPGRVVYLFAKDKAGNISSSASLDTTCQEVTYSDGSTCTKKCGGGTYNRVAYDKYSNARCSAQDKADGGSQCNAQGCCTSVTYQNGTTCSKQCGGGTYNRLAYSAYDGSRCTSQDKTDGGSSCNEQACCTSTEKYDCTSWGWSDCTKACGTGTKYEYRTCKLRSAYDHTTACTGTETEKRNEGTSCNTQTCCSSTENYDCGSWTWSDCTKACGTGTKYEYRSCKKRSAYDHTTACSGTATEKRNEGTSCNTDTCCSKTENYNCGSWTWTTCTKDCGGGTKYQKRTCQKRSAYDHTTACSGTATEKRNEGTECNTQACNPCAPNNLLNSSGFNCNPVCWYYSMAECSSNSGYCYYCP